MTKWEYHVFAATDADTFAETLNKFGRDGWEAVSANYTLGEPEEVRVGISTMTRPGRPQWIAVMKRPRAEP